MNKSRGCNTQYGNCGQQYCVANLKVAKRMDLGFHHKDNSFFLAMMVIDVN